MSDFNEGSGWWLACDGEWYPPQSLADWRREHATVLDARQGMGSVPRPVPSTTELEMPAPFLSGAPGWWEHSDGIWDPGRSPTVAERDPLVPPAEQAG